MNQKNGGGGVAQPVVRSSTSAIFSVVFLAVTFTHAAPARVAVAVMRWCVAVVVMVRVPVWSGLIYNVHFTCFPESVPVKKYQQVNT
ncbi:MAG: hypothetical protein LBK99_02350 [Opitutaceae bacterium]|nr:hypothetical protein [Opitutaceae bacterium]